MRPTLDYIYCIVVLCVIHLFVMKNKEVLMYVA